MATTTPQGFLGSLVERAFGPARGPGAAMPQQGTPRLVRRRPSLFESRAELAAFPDVGEVADTLAAPERAVPAPAIEAQRPVRHAAQPSPGDALPAPVRHEEPAIETHALPSAIERIVVAPPMFAPPVATPGAVEGEASRPSERQAPSQPAATMPHVRGLIERQPSRAPGDALARPALDALARGGMDAAQRIESRTHVRVLESRTIHEREAAGTFAAAASPAAAKAALPTHPITLIAPMQARPAAIAHPSRAAAFAAPPPPAAAAPLTVSIGRIEIRAGERATAASPQKRAAPAPRTGLDAYLRQRHRSGS